MDKFHRSMHFPIIWIFVILFIIFYPMLISIYVFFPLFIGVMGYILMQSIDKGKVSYIVMSIFYLINLEINLSLPFSLTIISILLVYMLFYHYLKFFRMCRVCKPIFSILLIDAIYLGSLLFYDFVFQSNSIMLDSILLYSLIVDILVVVIL